MIVTAQALIAAGIAPATARLFSAPLAAACERFEINTRARLAGFVAQCRVESRDFTALQEDLTYRDPDRIRRVFPSRVPDLMVAATLVNNPQRLANRVYSLRLGNGDERSGDGWRYRGRGLKQLTGKDNYTDAAEALGRPYVDQPELVAEPQDACLTAAWFWHSNKCNLLADRQEWDSITRVVNGPGMLEKDRRRQLSERGLAALA
jgi:putative chitinase